MYTDKWLTFTSCISLFPYSWPIGGTASGQLHGEDLLLLREHQYYKLWVSHLCWTQLLFSTSPLLYHLNKTTSVFNKLHFTHWNERHLQANGHYITCTYHLFQLKHYPRCYKSSRPLHTYVTNYKTFKTPSYTPSCTCILTILCLLQQDRNYMKTNPRAALSITNQSTIQPINSFRMGIITTGPFWLTRILGAIEKQTPFLSKQTLHCHPTTAQIHACMQLDMCMSHNTSFAELAWQSISMDDHCKCYHATETQCNVVLNAMTGQSYTDDFFCYALTCSLVVAKQHGLNTMQHSNNQIPLQAKSLPSQLITTSYLLLIPQVSSSN